MVVPSLAQVGAAIDHEDSRFMLEDAHNIGADYDKTLMAWFANFERAWPELGADYGERFYRTWKYYLLCCAGAFRSRKYSVWQLVLSPSGIRGGYIRPPLGGGWNTEGTERAEREERGVGAKV